MPEATDKREILLQNLKDAGCDNETISQCMALAESGQIAELTRKPAEHMIIGYRSCKPERN